MRKRLLTTGILLLLLILSALAGVMLGTVHISFSELCRFLCCPEPGNPVCTILRDIRFPRMITGIFAGASLAAAGAVLQGIMRNPLAEPGLIGITPGAGAAAMLILLVFPEKSFLVVPGAFAGALAAAVLVYFAAWDHGIHPLRLILAGVAVSGILGAVISLLFIFNASRIAGAVDFTVGTLASSSWEKIGMMFPYMITGLVCASLLSRRLNILTLGDDTASGLGLAAEWNRLVLLGCAALLAASAVSVAGLMGFVGLIAPHIVRLLIGTDHRFLIPASAVGGALLLTVCDTTARLAFAPVELPAGAILALLGPLFFLTLLKRGADHAS